MHQTLQILYEDNHIIAVFKASGVLTQSDYTKIPSLFDQIKEWIKTRDHKPGNAFLGIVHRLDRESSGVVLFAKTSKAASRISEQIRNRSTEKIYQILVQGELFAREGELRDFLITSKDDLTRVVSVVSNGTPGAKEAVLHFKVVESRLNLHRIEVNLLTGRKHQIRVQFSSRGLPIVGDIKYGSKARFSQGIALLSQRFSFDHPISRDRVSVTSPHSLPGLREIE